MKASYDSEIELVGGRITKGVVRVGDTVRRPGKECSSRATAILLHLEKVGFEGAPRFIGVDDCGRDILTYIEGTVPAKWSYHPDDVIRHAGKLLRAFHDATRGSELAGKSQVICHNDPGPNNVVFSSGIPMAFIDFDTAEPGNALSDLAYVAWSWCISSKPDRQPATEQARQIGELLTAYGAELSERSNLMNAIVERISGNIRFWERRSIEEQDVSPERLQNIISWCHGEIVYLQVNAAVFQAIVSDRLEP